MTSYGKDLICDTVNGYEPLLNDAFVGISAADHTAAAVTVTVPANVFTFDSFLGAPTTQTSQTIQFSMPSGFNLNNYVIDVKHHFASVPTDAQIINVYQNTSANLVVKRSSYNNTANLDATLYVLVRLKPKIQLTLS